MVITTFDLILLLNGTSFQSTLFISFFLAAFFGNIFCGCRRCFVSPSIHPSIGYARRIAYGVYVWYVCVCGQSSSFPTPSRAHATAFYLLLLFWWGIRLHKFRPENETGKRYIFIIYKNKSHSFHLRAAALLFFPCSLGSGGIQRRPQLAQRIHRFVRIIYANITTLSL